MSDEKARLSEKISEVPQTDISKLFVDGTEIKRYHTNKVLQNMIIKKRKDDAKTLNRVIRPDMDELPQTDISKLFGVKKLITEFL